MIVKPKLFAFGFGTFLLIVALLLHFSIGATLLLLNSWLHGSKVPLKGTTIELPLEDYFFPPTDESHVFIQKISSREGLIEISSVAFNSEDGYFAATKECEVRGCVNLTNRNFSSAGKKVTVIEMSYFDTQSHDKVKSYYWIEGSPLVLRFDGPPDSYLEYKRTINRLVEQLAGENSRRTGDTH